MSSKMDMLAMSDVGHRSAARPVRQAKPTHVPVGTLFAVKVTQVGGVAGDATTQCSFTYEVTDLIGNILGDSDTTPLSPVWERPPRGKFAPPSSAQAGSGIGFYDTDGSFKLIAVGEYPVPFVCPA